MADGPIPVGPATESVTAQPSLTDILAHDLFLVAVTAASLWIKNPAKQGTASILITLANQLINEHFKSST